MYSIWLIPSIAFYAPLHDQIKQIGNAHNLPIFIPHMTILSGIVAEPEHLFPIFSQCAEEILPLTLDTDGIGHQSDYFRSFYIKIKLNTRLEEIFNELTKRFQTNTPLPFEPHISLAYGLDQTLVEKIQLDMGIPKQIKMDALFLVNTKNPINEWYPLFTYP